MYFLTKFSRFFGGFTKFTDRTRFIGRRWMGWLCVVEGTQCLSLEPGNHRKKTKIHFPMVFSEGFYQIYTFLSGKDTEHA